MNAKTHEYYSCIEVGEDELLVDCYRNKVYFETFSAEDGGVFLNRRKVELLISQLNKWLEDTI